MITQAILDEYFEARRYDNLQDNTIKTLLFKEKHPTEFRFINAQQRKRSQLHKDVRIMLHYSNCLYFFTLTYKNSKDRNVITTKRKEAFSFCNSIFALFVLVEEEGETNGRYHLHGLGVLRDDKTMEDFYQWHSREDIVELQGEAKINARVKYLTSYLCKSVPRIRRNKRLSWLRRATDKFFDPVLLKNSPLTSKQHINDKLWTIDLLCLER